VGAIDETGSWITIPQFDEVGEFVDGLAKACIGAKQFASEAARYISGDPDAILLVGGRWGFIDKTGNWIMGPTFDGVGPFSEGFAAASIGGIASKSGFISGSTWGFIEKSGKWISEQLPP